MWHEYADHLYMNWGWDGSGNAWYEQGDWKPNDPNNPHNFIYDRKMYVDLYPVYNYGY